VAIKGVTLMTIGAIHVFLGMTMGASHVFLAPDSGWAPCAPLPGNRGHDRAGQAGQQQLAGGAGNDPCRTGCQV